MFYQLIYTIVCFLPAVFVLNRSPFWSNAFLVFVFGVATWNGANFYVEVRLIPASQDTRCLC